MFAVWSLCGGVFAAGPVVPQVVVVGLHVPGRVGELPGDDAERLTRVLDATGRVDALAPAEVGRRIAGREALILDDYALGPGRAKLKEGRVLYDRALPDQAIPALESAARLLSAGLAQSADARELHEALTLLGMAQVGAGDEAAARAAFRRSATLDPARQLDTVNYPPRVIELFDAVRREVAQVSPGHVAVTASAQATVFVDGREIGPAPNADIPLVAGEHFVLVRGEGGAAHFQAVTLQPGGRASVDAILRAGGVGEASADASGRGRQTRDLYASVGRYTDRAVVLLGGLTPSGQVALQLYSPGSGNFSRALTAEAGDDPVGALIDLAPAVVGYLNENGELRADRVSTQIIALDVSTNPVLAGLLYEPGAAQVATVSRKGVKWYVWAGVGLAAAGGGATAAILAGNASAADPESTDHGTITLHPPE